MEETRHLLRHLLATFAFRTATCLRDAPAGFAYFGAGNGVRTPAEVIRHMTGLMYFAHGLLVETPRLELPPLDWDGEVVRLQAALRDLDEAVAAASQWQSDPLAALQGPLADALTHTGQLATLRRLAGSPIQGGNYARAGIRAGELRLT